MLPQYGTVMKRGVLYYRTRIKDANGKLVAIYAKTPEELYNKETLALEQIENATFHRKTPTVAEYCEKWLLMQSVHVRATTLTDYTWIVVENQHEPLVDRKTFDIVQRKLKSRQRPRQTGEISLFAGLIKCGECGKLLTIRYTNEKHPKQIYSCKTYNAYGKQHCSQHRVEYDTLYRLVLNKIRECARAALMDGEAVAGKLSDTCEAEQKGQREALERSLAKDEERIDVLEKMVLRLYEDMVAGRISEANFNLLMEKTQKEQAELKARVEEGRKKLADEIRLACDARQWVEAIQEYADITELDAATLNRLIKEIVVHESIDSDKTRHISIEIHFNLKPIPEVEQVTA